MCSVIAQTEGETVRVVDEIFLRNASTKDACAEFVRRYGSHPGKVVVYGDSSGNHRQTTGNTDYEIIREYFETYCNLKVRLQQNTSNPDVRDRVNLVNRQLRSAAGAVSLVVDPKCKELAKDLEEVCYRAESGDIDKNRDRMRTHLSDALGYLIWRECQPRGKWGLCGDRRVL
jgi:hypothetical protein